MGIDLVESCHMDQLPAIALNIERLVRQPEQHATAINIELEQRFPEYYFSVFTHDGEDLLQKRQRSSASGSYMSFKKTTHRDIMVVQCAPKVPVGATKDNKELEEIKNELAETKADLKLFKGLYLAEKAALEKEREKDANGRQKRVRSNE